MPAFEKAWVEYCRLYNASAEEQTAALGRSLGRVSLRQSHSRLTAFAAQQNRDDMLAKRAWKEFIKEPPAEPVTRNLSGPEALHALEEAAWVSTNGAA
ncbi:MAG TPA: hypothetical protein VK907_10030 [Phnomibacter sp.]|nr:hypothetical protein [Phnomibacter sp.]